MQNFDRRRNRSENRAEALNLYLEKVAERNRLRAIAVSDRDGLFIGGSGTNDLELLAAVGAAYQNGAAIADELADCEDFHVSGVAVSGEELNVASVGDTRPNLDGATEAFYRILFRESEVTT